MHVVILDTNVLLSAIGWGGKPGQCLEMVRSGKIEGITCVELLEELDKNLRSLFKFNDQEVAQSLAELLQFLKVVKIDGSLRGASADPGDDKVLECAVAGHATHVITGDRRHLLPLKDFRGIRIVSAAEFLTIE
jgi:putative PIN family toxin of toxin-antitoxin system